MTDVVQFKINGKDYTVDGASVDEKLVNFIQDQGFRGTHVTCYEGGCGACTVVASVPVTGSSTGERKTISINSCLASLYGCDGWEITTVEGLGNRFDGYHVIQDRLADYSGTQCGYCSPGMVMNMYGLTEKGESWSASDVEKNLDGNLCRCTGYRPILDAFKSITTVDIEESEKNLKKCKKNCCCRKMTQGKQKISKKEIVVDGVFWYQPTSLEELNAILDGFSAGTNYRLVSGNTGNALYDDGPYGAFINTRMIPEMYIKSITSTSATFGANLSIAEMITELQSLAASNSGFAYLQEIADHWQKVANAQVRNLGSFGGNLMLRNMHSDMPSDIFITLLAAGATLNISSNSGENVAYYGMESFLGIDFVGTKSLLLQVRFTTLSSNAAYRSFKVMPRTVNSRAYVAGSFCLQLDRTSGSTVIGTPVLAFTGIGKNFYRASETEEKLVGKNLVDDKVLQDIFTALATEIQADNPPEDPSAEYKTSVAQNILYRVLHKGVRLQFILGLVSDVVAERYISGSTDMTRGTSSGTQTYEQNEDTWPLGKPIPKLESKIQCAGEAEYVKTMKPFEGELVGMFVQSTKANADILSIDATDALALPGVVGFLSAKDIPGQNNIIVYTDAVYSEELFASQKVSYYGQPIGIIVATSRGAAYSGIYAVKVEYENEQTPILNISDALDQGSTDTLPGMEFVFGDVEAGFSASDQIIEGEMTIEGQYHFHMETQSCVTVPTEDGLDVYASTQWITETQASIAQVLGVSDNTINLTTRRCGGGFGAKIDRCNIIATASALGAQAFRKPVKIDLDLSTNMAMIGWRDTSICNYKVGVTKDGIIQAIEGTINCDTGYVPVGAGVYTAIYCMVSCYKVPNWHMTPQVVITNTPSNTWCRTPSTMEGITFMENIMEHVAATLKMDPLELRRKNLTTGGGTRTAVTSNPKTRALIRAVEGPHNARVVHKQKVNVERSSINDMIDQIIESADYESRKAEVEAFNQSNRWRKRGIAIMPMMWPYGAPEVYGFGVIISIYARDSSVAVAHGGVELGQGINTKVAQVAAYTLGCSLDKIKVRPTNTLHAANSNCTGGSLGSDFNMYCMQKAAQKLRTRLDEVSGTTWDEKVQQAFANGVDLTERYWNGKGEVQSYAVQGVACSEVEIDVLTGNLIVRRADILEDAGKSPSPLIDIGQIEGAFVMGQGLFTTERPIADPETGRRITDTTWLYKPPTALDIPVDFRVSMLQNAPNENGVLSSKVTGEPPLCLSFSIIMALRQAINSARQEVGNEDWYNTDTPMEIDRIQNYCLVDQTLLTYGNI